MRRSFTTFSTICLLAAAGSAFFGCEREPPPQPPEPEPEPAPVTSQVPPPPISGGTLLVTADRKIAVAADPDRDRLALIDIEGKALLDVIPLEPGDEPGRVVEGPEGVVHVALRRGGAIVTLDLESSEITRRPICPAPRGMAYDESTDLVHVACAGGELVSLPAEPSGAPVRELHIDGDLRDVLVLGDGLLVTRFLSAELLAISADGQVVDRAVPPQRTVNSGSFSPGVAYRAIRLPGGGVALAHQRGFDDEIDLGDGDEVPPAPYAGGACDGQTIVHMAVSVISAQNSGGELKVRPLRMNVGGLGRGTLPVDIAASDDGETIAVVAAGTGQLVVTSLANLRKLEPSIEPCGFDSSKRRYGVRSGPIAVAAHEDETFLVLTRDPPGLEYIDDARREVVARVEIPGESRSDTGHDIFHGRPQAIGRALTIACASCHPEGDNDGRVWHLSTGARRTQSLGGGVMETAPFHWNGDMQAMASIVADTFVKRMGGPAQDQLRIDALSTWLNTVPVVPISPAADPGAVARGEALFFDSEVACAKCHSGDHFTNNRTMDVGTGQPFQVPSLLGLGHRAPYMHDGCAPTLHDRFGPCGGGDAHGVTSHLSPSDIDDLVAYLETL